MPRPAPRPAAKAAAKPAGRHPRAGSIETGDHVYAHHPERGPMAVKVLAHGRDGFTGEDGSGARHSIAWDRMLGHKKRVAMDMQVLDQGQEGTIVQDNKGRKRFLAGDIGAGAAPATPQKDDQTMRPDPLMDGLETLGKSLAAGGRVVFLKAQVANRPGLALRPVTDKAGHQTKRWVRTMKDAPAQPRQPGHDDKPTIHDPRQTDIEDFAGKPGMKHGDHVSFRHGEVRGHGWIVASGRDGVRVKDGAGQEHNVRHEALEGPAKGGGDGGNPPSAMTDDKLDYPDHRPGGAEQDAFSAATFMRQNDVVDQAAVDAVLKDFPPDTAAKIKAVQARLLTVTDTQKMHKKGGAYTPERQALHKTIEDHFLNDAAIAAARPAEGQPPTFTILGGRGGSGKSWFKGQVYDPRKAIVLDADEIKHMLPEYEGWNAGQVHEESSDLFDTITNTAQKLGLNIVHDATMKTPAKAVSLVQRFKKDGYRIEAHYMHLPRAEAAKRAVKRFLGKAGRFVPPEVVLGNTQNEMAFDQVKELADAWSFRDNQNKSGVGPSLIKEKKDGRGTDVYVGRREADQGTVGREDGLPGLPSGSGLRGAGGAEPTARQADRGGKGPKGSPLRKGGTFIGRALFFLTGGRVVR